MEVFRQAEQVLERAMVQGADQTLQTVKAQAERFVTDYEEVAYKTLVGTAFGKNRSPSYAPPWPDLAPGYTRRKNNTLRNEFYVWEFELRDELLARSPKQDLGAASVEVIIDKDRSKTNSLVFKDRSGRLQWRPGSGRRGFASYAEAFSRIEFGLRVKLFPKTQGRRIDTILGLISNTDKLKFQEFGTKHSPARPLVGPFLNWYTGPALQQQLRERFGATT